MIRLLALIDISDVYHNRDILTTHGIPRCLGSVIAWTSDRRRFSTIIVCRSLVKRIVEILNCVHAIAALLISPSTRRRLGQLKRLTSLGSNGLRKMERWLKNDHRMRADFQALADNA
jgi:hypothetical protein